MITKEEYEESVDMKNFDYELMDACLAKYGMVCEGANARDSYRDDAEWYLSCKLHEDDSDCNDDDED